MTLRATAFLADSAEAVGGKLYVLGAGWDTVGARTLPVIHPRVSVGAIIAIGWSDTDVEHDVTLRLETEDGQSVPLGRLGTGTGPESVIAQLGHRFTAHRSDHLRPGDDQSHPIAFTVNDLHIPAAGGYSWVLSIDGSIAARLPMRVVHTPGA